MDSNVDSTPTLEELVLSEPSLWLTRDAKLFAGKYHTLPRGIHWATSIGRPFEVVVHKIMAPPTCSMPVEPSNSEARAYARCLEDLVEVCDVGLQMPVEEGDETITAVGYNIFEVHDDGSMTLVPCEPEEDS